MWASRIAAHHASPATEKNHLTFIPILMSGVISFRLQSKFEDELSELELQVGQDLCACTKTVRKKLEQFKL